MKKTPTDPVKPPLRVDQAEPGITSMTRRRLLMGTGQAALFAMLPMACTPAVSLPWADGTYWDDGLGWTD